MPPALDTPRRNLLERAVLQAREAAEGGADRALKRLGADLDQPPAHLSEDERVLRRSLLAQRRRLGEFDNLVAECAYGYWHRMLFARFLAESDLLIHPDHQVPVTLEECDELAAEEGAPDGWTLAARYASRMLPEIFRRDDPVLDVPFAPEDRRALERILADLPASVFAADDSLGWVYQFWQKARKDEINLSGDKIDRHTIGPVTQLFTEHYMVQFLLQNTLGAWWVRRHPGEDIPHPMSYLRFLEDGTPAAGAFPEWPDTAAQLRVLDPCCGSGHFLVAAFRYLSAFRMAEEGLSEAEAGDRVLAENLFGLEIDPRCTQIAAFNLALAAWRRGGYRPLPSLNVACSGLPVGASRDDWLKLANDDHRLRTGMAQLYDLFQQAPDLGSLIDPTQVAGANLFAAGFAELQPLLLEALAREQAQRDDSLRLIGVAAHGMARAGEILAGKYHLVSTNVPYLARGKQGNTLRDYIERHHDRAKQDLATAFVERCLNLCTAGGTIAVITPQNWLFLSSYKRMREHLLRAVRWDAVALLGPKGFQTPMWDFNIALYALSNHPSVPAHQFAGLDAQQPRVAAEKARLLREGDVMMLSQAGQLDNPDARVVLGEVADGPRLERYAAAYAGICSGDFARFGRLFWEISRPHAGWAYQQTTTRRTVHYGGYTNLFLWEDGVGVFAAYVDSLDGRLGGSWRRGGEAWGRRGVLVSQMQSLAISLYNGALTDNNTAVIVPKDPAHLPAIWAFCSSPEFRAEVRKIDQKLSVTNATLVQVPFDLERWQKVAEEMGPLPEPYSEDPTQWLFEGNPARSTAPLQVAVARLLGYRWPEQEKDHGLGEHEDQDGIVCLHAGRGQAAAAERLRLLLAAAYGEEWSAAKQEELLSGVGFGGKTLGDWLREGFFKQHCALFHQRPFIWHIWDGRKDGFAALVNYHKLDQKLLEKLAYDYLGAWIRRQDAAVRAEDQGADARLVAAQELQKQLELILEGESPHDIFVRWKPLHELPMGWRPDLNDGVRMNIRPFMMDEKGKECAGLLRVKPTIKWNKDRGKNPPGSPYGDERHNDLHFTLEEKRKAREEAGEAT